MLQQDFNVFYLPVSNKALNNKALIKNIVPDKQSRNKYWLITENPGRLIQHDATNNTILNSISSFDYDTIFIKLLVEKK